MKMTLRDCTIEVRAELTGAGLPEGQFILGARVADKIFAIGTECQGRDGLLMRRDHLTLVLTKLVDSQVTIRSAHSDSPRRSAVRDLIELADRGADFSQAAVLEIRHVQAVKSDVGDLDQQRRHIGLHLFDQHLDALQNFFLGPMQNGLRKWNAQSLIILLQRVVSCHLSCHRRDERGWSSRCNQSESVSGGSARISLGCQRKFVSKAGNQSR